LSHLAHKYLVVTDTDPSTVETMTGNFNHSAYRLGQENGAVTVSIEALTGIQSVGSGVSHDLAIMQTANGAISYTLDPAIQYGDQIRYVLNTEYGLWTKRDTIVKTFGSITSQFIDDASTVVNWTGNWSTTTNEYVSPTQSFTDSPTGDYNNNTTRTYTFNQVIDLSHVTEAAVNYYAKWEIESDYDFCQFQVSIDGGTTWIGQCGLYTSIATSSDGVQPVGEPVYQGAQSAWVLEEISLSDYIGETDVRLRFVLKSDGGVRMDGFYFDDFELMYNIDYTGVEETGLSAKSMPNPANTYAQIAFDQPISTGLVSVYSMTGELIHSEKVSDLTNKIVLNTEKWSEGMYTVVVSETAQFISPAKLVVVH
jgi:carboxypeptidase T